MIHTCVVQEANPNWLCAAVAPIAFCALDFTIGIGVGKDKKFVVLEHFLLVWHIIRTFEKIIM